MGRYMHRQDMQTAQNGQAAAACNPSGPNVAMAYVQPQQIDAVYEPTAGFCRGTIFPELDKPFLAAGGNCHGR